MRVVHTFSSQVLVFVVTTSRMYVFSQFWCTSTVEFTFFSWWWFSTAFGKRNATGVNFRFMSSTAVGKWRNKHERKIISSRPRLQYLRPHSTKVVCTTGVQNRWEKTHTHTCTHHANKIRAGLLSSLLDSYQFVRTGD